MFVISQPPSFGYEYICIEASRSTNVYDFGLASIQWVMIHTVSPLHRYSDLKNLGRLGPD